MYISSQTAAACAGLRAAKGLSAALPRGLDAPAGSKRRGDVSGDVAVVKTVKRDPILVGLECSLGVRFGF